MTACITGWAHSQFGKLEGQDVESLSAEVALAAVADAGLEPHDIDAIFVGHFNNGFSRQDFTAGLLIDAHPDFRFKPATRLENACASGAAAIHAGLTFLDGKRGHHALVVGVEKMTDMSPAEAGQNLLNACYRKEEEDVDGGFVGMFARITSAYFQKYGSQSEALARIAAKNHKNGVDNPYAQIRKDLGFEFCNTVSEKNPYVVEPLRRTDCSLISDGAAAVVLSTVPAALAMDKAIVFRASTHTMDFLPMSRRDATRLEGTEVAWRKAFDQADIDVMDLDFVEVHDCFTIAELMQYEAMGLTPYGKGAVAALEGWIERDGKLPVNPSGGLKAKGHPIGATGVSMHVMACLQLMAEAGGMQVKDAALGGVLNMGGTSVASYASILERLR